MKTSALAFAASMFMAGTAQAAIITVEYSVNITGLAEEYIDPYSYQEVSTSYTSGVVFYVGEPFTGRFTYDDTAPLLPGIDGYYGPVHDHTITFGQSETTIVLSSRAATTRTEAGDGFGVTGGGFTQNTSDPYFYMEMSLLAPAGTHGPETMPTLAAWQHYAAAPSNPFWMVINGNGVNVYLTGGNIALQVSAVPEPATVGMTLAGVAILAVAARRRKTARP